jgi:hypothetical protein
MKEILASAAQRPRHDVKLDEIRMKLRLVDDEAF